MAEKINGGGMNSTQQKTLDNLTVSLREYVDLRFQTNEREVAEARRQASMALEKAETAMTKRLDLMNEFRDTLADANKTYLPRTEYDAAHCRLTEDVKVIQKYQAEFVLRREFESLNTKIGEIKTDVDIAKGKASQASVYIGWALSVSALIMAAIKMLS